MMLCVSRIVLVLGVLHTLIVCSTCSTDLYNELAQQVTSLQAQVDALTQRPGLSRSTCVGRTTSKEFQPYPSKGIVVHINTAHCQFNSTPIYLTSLRGDGSHWQAVGMSSIYGATPDSFRIYLSFVEDEGRNTTTLLRWANEYRWEIDWMAVERL